jgi:hypothetical protein
VSDREIETNSKKEPDSAKSGQRRNKILWGAENPNLARKLFVALCFGVGLVMFYAMMNRGFFPSEPWKTVSIFMSMILSLFMTAGFYHAHKTGKIKPRNRSKPGLLAYIFMLVFFFPLMLWLTITEGFGCAYTLWLGETAMKTVAINEKNTGRAYKSYTTTYCLKGEELDGDIFFSKLCVKKDDYDRIKVDSSMTVYGKESWFGFAFEKYRIIIE